MTQRNSLWPQRSHTAQIAVGASRLKQGGVSVLWYWEQNNIWTYFPLLPSSAVT